MATILKLCLSLALIPIAWLCSSVVYGSNDLFSACQHVGISCGAENTICSLYSSVDPTVLQKLLLSNTSDAVVRPPLRRQKRDCTYLNFDLPWPIGCYGAPVSQEQVADTGSSSGSSYGGYGGGTGYSARSSSAPREEENVRQKREISSSIVTATAENAVRIPLARQKRDCTYLNFDLPWPIGCYGAPVSQEQVADTSGGSGYGSSSSAYGTSARSSLRRQKKTKTTKRRKHRQKREIITAVENNFISPLLKQRQKRDCTYLNFDLPWPIGCYGAPVEQVAATTGSNSYGGYGGGSTGGYSARSSNVQRQKRDVGYGMMNFGGGFPTFGFGGPSPVLNAVERIQQNFGRQQRMFGARGMTNNFRGRSGLDMFAASGVNPSYKSELFESSFADDVPDGEDGGGGYHYHYFNSPRRPRQPRRLMGRKSGIDANEFMDVPTSAAAAAEVPEDYGDVGSASMSRLRELRPKYLLPASSPEDAISATEDEIFKADGVDTNQPKPLESKYLTPTQSASGSSDGDENGDKSYADNTNQPKPLESKYLTPTQSVSVSLSSGEENGEQSYADNTNNQPKPLESKYMTPARHQSVSVSLSSGEENGEKSYADNTNNPPKPLEAKYLTPTEHQSPASSDGENDEKPNEAATNDNNDEYHAPEVAKTVNTYHYFDDRKDRYKTIPTITRKDYNTYSLQRKRINRHIHNIHRQHIYEHINKNHLLEVYKYTHPHIQTQVVTHIHNREVPIEYVEKTYTNEKKVHTDILPTKVNVMRKTLRYKPIYEPVQYINANDNDVDAQQKSPKSYEDYVDSRANLPAPLNTANEQQVDENTFNNNNNEHLQERFNTVNVDLMSPRMSKHRKHRRSRNKREVGNNDDAMCFCKPTFVLNAQMTGCVCPAGQQVQRHNGLCA